jgi:hypothetical protein
MITNRDSGVADGPHAAVVYHRLDDDPGSLGEAARASWRGTLFTWVHGLSLLCNIWSSLRAYEPSCSHTIHGLTGGMARFSDPLVFRPMEANTWRMQGMNLTAS